MNSRHRTFEQLESVCWLMMRAGWLEHYRVDRKSGIATEWTNLGCCRKKMLSQVIRTLGVNRGISDTFEFSECACSQDGASPADFQNCARAFWLACMEDLRMNMDPEAVRAFVRILSTEESRPRECLVTPDSFDTVPADATGFNPIDS